MCEYWLPAQHNSGDVCPVSLLQKDSDTLATKGMVVAYAGAFPWLAVLVLWDDPLEPLWCAGGVSLSPSRLLVYLYVGASSKVSAWRSSSVVWC